MSAERRCTKCGGPNHTSARSTWCHDCHRDHERKRRADDPTYMARKMAERRQDPAKRERDRLVAKANQRAVRRLALRHVDEYLDVLDEVRAEMGLEPAHRPSVLGRLGAGS